MAKPTIVFVPGAWHGPEIYDATMANLSSHGYLSVGLPLPSVGAHPPHTSFDGDVGAIRDCLTRLVEIEEKEVSSGFQAPVGLAKSQRAGRKGGVVRLVFIMSFAMPEGFQPTAYGVPYPDWMRVDLDKGVVTVLPEDARAIFYNDMSSAEGDRWAAEIRPQSVGVYTSTTTYAAWRYIPSTFVIAKQDKTTFTPEIVDSMITSARQQVPAAFDVVETCDDGGHCLMISHPDWLANALRRAAGEMM
nr:hypothetical protein CFP56_48814 [Quercus suber]